MSCVVKDDLRRRDILAERLSARRNEERIIFPPSSEQRRLRFAEVLLERRIQLHVARVIEEKVELGLGVTSALYQDGIQPVGLGLDLHRVCHAMYVLPLRSLQT